MRGFHLLIIWVMALAVTIAYAAKVQAPPKEIVESDLVVEDKKKAPPPKEIVEEDLVVDHGDDDDDDEEIVEEPVREQVDIEPPRRPFSLEINARFGRSLGCVIPNCGSFMPMQRMCGTVYIQGYSNQCMPPMQHPPVIYQNVYVPQQQNPMQGFCPCQGQMGCGCGAQASLLFVNNVQRIESPRIGWDGVNGQTRPVWGPTPQAMFEVPVQHEALGPRNTGYIPRLGFGPNAGSN